MAVFMLRFTRRPFRAAVAPDLYVAASAHDSALTQLRQAVADGPAILDLTGDAGTGKTLIVLKLLAEFASARMPIYLPNAHYQTTTELHQAILHDLGKPHEGLSTSLLWLAVNDALLESTRTLLVLDDADSMSDEVLADLRRFGNLTVRGESVASIVLVGSTDLSIRLRALPALAPRLGRTIRLELLSEDAAVEYLREQAILAGGSDETFTDEAAAMIAAHAHGVARALNGIAAEAIALALEAGESSVDVEAVLAALPAESAETSQLVDSSASARHPRTVRVPKEKARKRKAA